MKPETNYHVIQECHRTHGGRIRRHDRVVDELAKNLVNRYTVIKEPKLRTEVGLRKPDLLLIQGNKALIVDVQVRKGNELGKSHKEKLDKYKNVRNLTDLVKNKYREYNIHDVDFRAITVSWKGVIERETSKTLKELGINERLKFLIVTSVLRGAWINWTLFNQITTMTRGGRYYH